METRPVRFPLRRLSWLLLALAPAMAENTPLGLGGGNSLQVSLGNEALVAADALTLADFRRARVEAATDVPGWDRVTVMNGGSKKDCIYYREVGLRANRIEMTWYIKFAPYQFGTDFPGHSYNLGGARYEMKIPIGFLDGAHYRVVTGPLQRSKVKEGQTARDAPEGKDLEGPIWYITFTKGERAVTFDLNPVGPHNIGRKSMLCEKDWRLTRQGEHFVLWANMRRVKWGDMREFKVVITPTEWAYEKVHATNKRGHSPYIHGTKLINFGPDEVKRYLKGDCSTYTPERGHGWLDSSGLKVVATDFADPLRKGYVEGGEQKKTYLIDARNGVYLINLVFGSAKEASGPFDVFATGRRKLTGLATKKGEFTTKTLHTRADNGKIELAFQGKSWMLNGLSVVPLIMDTEDYLIGRTWWIQQKPFIDWFADVEPIPAMPPIVPKAPGPDPMAWAWNAGLETLEASLDSNRAALDTPETVQQRLSVIRAAGFKGVIIGGQHFRYNQKDSVKTKILLRNTRLAVETAHRLGLKVIDHWDFNWVFYPGYPALMRVLDQDPDCLQRHANPLTISTSFCLNSSVFMDEFKRFLIQEQKATNVDGYMLDEVNWVRAPYCLCDRCRRVFHEETGLRLPYEISGFLENFDHPLWREFVAWRGRKTREVFADLRVAVRTVRPDVIFLRYTSAPISRPHSAGLELNQGMPWGVDYVGDEYHCDDILMNWRTMFARLKNRQGMVASYGNAPTWILPRNLSHDTRVLYAWSLARMNRGNVWYRAGDRAFTNKLHSWPWQMKDQHARPLSDVAVLLSQPTRNFSGDVSYYHAEHYAWLQTLAEENIQYRVIIDRDITPEKLSRYKALLLANVALLSEKQAAAIKAFAAAGGSAIAVYETGLFDEKGQRRGDSILAGAMNVQKLGYVPWKTRIVAGSLLAEGMATPHFETTIKQCAYRLRDEARSRVLADMFDAVKGTPIAPAIVETPYGKGRFFYIAGTYLKQNFEPRMASPANKTHLGRRAPAYPTRMNRDLNVLTRNLLTLAIGDHYRTRAARIPEKVVCAAFEQNHDGKSTILIHFLNCRGKPDLKFGDPLKLLDPIPQPPLPADIELHVKSPVKIASAFVVAPLRDGRTEVRAKPIGGDTYSVTVPKAAIENYAILYLQKAEYRPTWQDVVVPVPEDIPTDDPAGRLDQPAAMARRPDAATGEPYEPDDHTLLLMHFDETEGESASDAKSPSLKGTLANMREGHVVWAPGRFDRALSFVSNGQQMLIPDRKERRFAFTETQDFTIDLWLHTNPNSTQDRQSIVFTGATSSKTPGLGLYVFGGRVVAQLSDGQKRQDSRLYLFGDGSIKGDWHHVALVVDRTGALGKPGMAYLYIDGIQQQKPRDISNHDSFQGGDLRLGSYTATSNYGFDGKLDELRISSKARPPRELGYGGYFPQR